MEIIRKETENNQKENTPKIFKAQGLYPPGNIGVTFNIHPTLTNNKAGVPRSPHAAARPLPAERCPLPHKVSPLRT